MIQPGSSSAGPEWRSLRDLVFKILVATRNELAVFAQRPRVLESKATTQIFVEWRPARRYGGDKWRNSGGQSGGQDVWLQEHAGVRKRYGKVIREFGQPLRFWSFSLLRRPGAQEDRSVVVYVVDGAAPRAQTNEPFSELDPARLQVAKGPPTIDLSPKGCTESFRRLPCGLPGREATSRRSDYPRSHAVANIDANMVLSSHRQTSQCTPPTAMSPDRNDYGAYSAEKSPVGFGGAHSDDQQSLSMTSDGSSLCGDSDCREFTMLPPMFQCWQWANFRVVVVVHGSAGSVSMRVSL